MALLMNSTSRKSVFRISAVAMALAVTACSLAGIFGSAEERLPFSHLIHLDEGLECGDCHMGTEDSDEPGMPGLAGCMLCHESMQDEDTPPEKRIETLFDADGNSLSAQLSRLPEETIFSHLKHVTAELECGACHVGIDSAEVIDANVVVTMDDCTTCHTQQKVANDCTTCHTIYDIERAPPTHDHNWDKIHGRTVRAKMEGRVNDCSLCHTEQTCISCHRDEQPQSHTNYFRLRGHGIQASIDRDSCAACHRAESCDRCHSETQPLSHGGSWGGTRSTHCVSCHEPLSSTSCYTCHKDTPSHRLATPKPPGHVSSMNCRLCHGMGQSLPHVDNGSDCNSCHR